MKPITFIRGALVACACFWLWALPSVAAAAGTGTSKSGTSIANEFGQQKKLNLQSTTAVHTSGSSIGGSVIRTIVVLIVVIGVIYALAWVVRKTKAAGAVTGASGDGLEQVANLPLGTGRSVTLIRVGDELHLLGVADHGVSELRVFSEEEAYELGIPFHADEPSVGNSLAGRVVEAVRKRTIR